MYVRVSTVYNLHIGINFLPLLHKAIRFPPRTPFLWSCSNQQITKQTNKIKLTLPPPISRERFSFASALRTHRREEVSPRFCLPKPLFSLPLAPRTPPPLTHPTSYRLIRPSESHHLPPRMQSPPPPPLPSLMDTPTHLQSLPPGLRNRPMSANTAMQYS